MLRTASLKFCERIATKESDRSVGDSCVCGGPILGIRNKNIYYTVCNNLFLVFVCCKCQRSVQLLIPIWSSSEMFILLALPFIYPGFSSSADEPDPDHEISEKGRMPPRLRTDRQTSIYKGIGFQIILRDSKQMKNSKRNNIRYRSQLFPFIWVH